MFQSLTGSGMLF